MDSILALLDMVHWWLAWERDESHDNFRLIFLALVAHAYSGLIMRKNKKLFTLQEVGEMNGQSHVVTLLYIRL